MSMPNAGFLTAKYGAGTYILFMVCLNEPFTIYSTPPVSRRMRCRRSWIYSLECSMNKDVQKLFQLIIKDIGVELGDEFDKNFERQAFFSEAWQRRKSPIRNEGRAILTDSGQLRSSIGKRMTENSITFYSNLPYADIHNDGGEIVVTKRMKGFFWHKYMNAAGALTFARRKDGSLRKDKGTRQISAEAEFWQAMALMKPGAVIKIPRRRFLGYSPEVEQAVRDVIEGALNEFVSKFKLDYKINK